MGLSDDSDDGSDRAEFEPAANFSAITRRTIDREAGVVLYAAYEGGEGYGLAAVPVKDTDLELDDA